MKPITSVASLPDEARAVYHRIETAGFGWALYLAWKIPDSGKHIQVRDIAKLAPPMRVARYAAAMERGDRFPPIIVTRDGWVVDGNTRVAAARKLGLKIIDQFRIDADWEGAQEINKSRMIGLGTGENQTHGEGMSRKDTEARILDAYVDGTTARELADLLHIPRTTVEGVLSEHRARMRCEAVGVPNAKDLPASHLKCLGGLREKVTNPVYRELASLTSDLRLSVEELNKIRREVIAMPTEAERLSFIAAERAANPGRVRRLRARATSSSQVRRALGVMLGFEDKPETVTEPSSGIRDKYLADLYRARRWLDLVIAEQQKIAATTGTTPGPVTPSFRFGTGR